MPYNTRIDRTDAQDLIPEVVSREIIEGVAEQSVCLSTFRRLSNMSSRVHRMPVLSALPTAYFVYGAGGDDGAGPGVPGADPYPGETNDIGLKQTTTMAWDRKYITAEEIAVIVPIPENVIADADYDLWAEVKPRIVEAFHVLIDQTMLIGVTGATAPASWPNGLAVAANAATNRAVLGAGADFVDDVNSTMALVEADGFEVNGFIAPATIKATLRGLRDANGGLLFVPSMQSETPGTIYGEPVAFGRNGAFSTANFSLIALDRAQVVYSIRQDMTFKILDQAVLQDDEGAITYNLAQQDMVALRCVMRLGWQVPNPINRMNANAATRFPAAVLV